jgi:hypothetical protein
MRGNARREFLSRYLPDRNYQMLRGVYDAARAHFAGRPVHRNVALDVLPTPFPPTETSLKPSASMAARMAMKEESLGSV